MISLTRVKNQEKVIKALLNGVDRGNVEYLSCGEVEALGYFQLTDIRYDDWNVVPEKVSTALLQLYLI